MDGWRDGVHTGLLYVGGCVLWIQRYQDVVTQLVVRLHEIDVRGGHMACVLCIEIEFFVYLQHAEP